MLLELHNTIQRLLYERGQISPREVDITFEAPTRERIEKLMRPTISLFFFELQENIELRQNNFSTTRSNGHVERHAPARRFDLRYMISVLTTNIEDEHELIWRVLLTLVQHPQIPPEILSEALGALEPPLSTRVSQPDEGQRLSGIWTALGVPPHPALSYTVTVPVEMNIVIEAPLVLTRTAHYRRMHAEEDTSEVSNQIGGVVRNSQGKPLANVGVTLEGRSVISSKTNQEGQFVLMGVSSGRINLLLTHGDGSQKSVTVEVPERQVKASSSLMKSYDIVLEEAKS